MTAIYRDKIYLENEQSSGKIGSLYWELIIKGATAKRHGELRVCITCQAPVSFLTTTSKLVGKIAVIPDECNACREKSWQEHLRSEEIARFQKNFGKCNGNQNRPASFRGEVVHWDQVTIPLDFQLPFIRYIEQIGSNYKTMPSFFVTGPTGTGKTFLSKLLHNELLAAYHDSCFIKAVDLAILIRRIGMDRTMGHVMNELRNVENLIVDDFGTQKNTEFVKEAMFSIFDYRYDNRKRTMLTTNLTLEAILEEEPRLGSRFGDSSWMKQMQLIGKDIRR